MDLNTDKQNTKTKHIITCLTQQVSYGNNQFSKFRLKHNPLSNLNYNNLKTNVNFLGHNISYPFFISPITGGSNTENINNALFEIANFYNIPLFLGSFKILRKHPEYISHFRFKDKKIPIVGNIGATYCNEENIDFILKTIYDCSFDALSVHLNTGQELIQKDGDRDFTDIVKNLELLKKKINIPVIVKECGFGIPIEGVEYLISIGIDYIDIAGAGGTNWISVENYINDSINQDTFNNHGYKTVEILETLNFKHKNKVMASGGLDSGLDIAICLSLNSFMCGFALNIINKLICIENGNQIKIDNQKAKDYIDKIIHELKISMILTKTNDVNDFDFSKILKN